MSTATSLKATAFKSSRRSKILPAPAAAPRAKKGVIWTTLTKHGPSGYITIFDMPSLDRAGLVKEGTPSTMVGVISKDMDIPKDRFVRITGLSRATVSRKIARNADFSADESERIVGLAKLIGQVETIVRESGTAEGFKPAKWFGEWIAEPAPALGGRKPEELLDTSDGREAVAKLLAQMQSGAYA